MRVTSHYDWGFRDGRFIGLLVGVLVGLIIGLWVAHSPYVCHF